MNGLKINGAVYSTLTANIRSRRGSKVAINLPIYFDEKTSRPFKDPTVPWDREVYPEDSGRTEIIILLSNRPPPFIPCY